MKVSQAVVIQCFPFNWAEKSQKIVIVSNLFFFLPQMIWTPTCFSEKDLVSRLTQARQSCSMNHLALDILLKC